MIPTWVLVLFLVSTNGIGGVNSGGVVQIPMANKSLCQAAVASIPQVIKEAKIAFCVQTGNE